MREIRLDSFKVANALPLPHIAAYFGLPETSRRREYIALQGEPLRKFTGIDRDGSAAYIFRYGCLAFVDFNPDETRRFTDMIRPLAGPGFAALSNHETHAILVDDQGAYRLFEGAPPAPFDPLVVPTIANALAKLSALSSMETGMNRTLDEAELFIERLGRGKLWFNAGRYAKEISKIVRFQYNSAFTARLFERCDIADAHIEARRLYDKFMELHEYADRIQSLRQKTDTLNNIIDLLLPLSSNWQESGELYVEIIMLAIFPLFYLL